ncbi:protein PTOV1 homolog [Drosophila biarmipes]|uniref:protein PTOV1 homolog n=1 Tax=Drosophila biarmipes TaxID=125945 RepID=UPI0007E73B30|nr:protein PTOV1 homolog [Drosophila biarmipes]
MQVDSSEDGGEVDALTQKLGEMLLQELPANAQQGQPAFAGAIWSGQLEWRKLGQPEGRNTLPLTISSNFVDGQPEVTAESWPIKLRMQLMPKPVLVNVGISLLKDSKMVRFRAKPGELRDSLVTLLSAGFCGCVHVNPASNCRILILIYVPSRNDFLGFIPNNQITYVQLLREALEQLRDNQKK